MDTQLQQIYKMFGLDSNLMTKTKPLTNITPEEEKILYIMGYDPVLWDRCLQEGKIIKDDVQARINLYNTCVSTQNLLDDDLKKRLKKDKEKSEPKFKKGDVFKTKEYGTLLVTKLEKSIYPQGEDIVRFVDDNGTLNWHYISDFEKLISE